MISAIVIRCDDCTDCSTAVRNTIAEARQAARAKGWSSWRENGRTKDLCGACHHRRYGTSGAA